MRMRNLLVAATAISLGAAPIAAQAADTERSSEPVSGESSFGGEIGPAIIIVALAAVGMIALLVADDDEDQPISA